MQKMENLENHGKKSKNGKLGLGRISLMGQTPDEILPETDEKNARNFIKFLALSAVPW